jgi:sulfite reductase (ferredoxin)
LKVSGQFVDAYYFCLGGGVGAFQTIARPVGYRCAATEVPEAIERLLRVYLEQKHPDENLRRFFARHSETELRSYLAGSETTPVERDPSPGRVPAGVAG